MQRLFLSCIFSWIVSAVTAQTEYPVLKGSVVISIQKGTFECDLTLSNIPQIKDYALRLNSGMNVYAFLDSNGHKLIPEVDLRDTLSYGESTAWYFKNSKGKFLPRSLKLRYVGMFPVYRDTSATEDWRGKITFNGTSLRADGLQSAWYPVLFDKINQKRYEQVRYDLDITCADCSILFINGSQPVRGARARFVSDFAQEPLLFCGDFEMSENNGSYLINAGLNKEDEGRLLNLMNKFKTYFQNKTNLPYKIKTTIVHAATVAKEYGFMFVAFPCIMDVNDQTNSLGSFLQEGGLNARSLAHELAHYYFGHLKELNSPIGAAIKEGFSEYLSWKALQHEFGDNIYQKVITQKVTKLRSFEPVPIAAIHEAGDFGNRELYLYYYTPLLLTAIEAKIGEKQMWQWINKLLTTPVVYTDYEFIKKTLLSILSDPQQYSTVTKTILESSASMLEIKNVLHLQEN